MGVLPKIFGINISHRLIPRDARHRRGNNPVEYVFFYFCYS